jgi:hypothetical protein
MEFIFEFNYIDDFKNGVMQWQTKWQAQL